MPNENAELLQAKPDRPQERRRAANHIDIYANNAQITGNYFDFQVAFGEILEASLEKLVTEDLVTVKMSPQLAKRLSELLISHIEKYEAMFGAIPEANRVTVTQESELTH
jgi:hypothetical protein